MDNQIHKNTGLGYAILHFYLYSSLHIAICAMAITAFSYLSVSETSIDFGYIGFVGASTLLLYSLHRIIGINKSDSYATQGRFAIIIKYKSHLIIYSIVSVLYCIYAYYTFDWTRRLLLIVPALLSLSYSLPIFFDGKRLRDFHWIKIFLIATCWAVITCTIPYYESNELNLSAIFLITLERAIFIFAITIPFDIRDRAIDKSTGVMTLASINSDITLKRISWLALIVAGAVAAILFSQDIYNSVTILALTLTYIFTAYLIHLTNEKRTDYFFTGLMDGTMLLPLLILYLHFFLTSTF